MYKHPAVKTLMNPDERAKHEYEAFLNYREPKDQTENLLTNNLLVVFLNLYDQLKKVLDNRIQDYFYLEGFRSNIDFPEEYKIVGIDEDEIIVSYRTYNRNICEYVDANLTIPIQILTDPNFLNDRRSQQTGKLSLLKANAGIKD